MQATQQQQLGELWICLRPNQEELRDCGSRINYQQQIILEVIEQYGFDQQVFIQPPPEIRERGQIPAVQRHLHQLIRLEYTSDYLVIQEVPQVTEERLYRYNWRAGYTFRAVTYTVGRRSRQQ